MCRPQIAADAATPRPGPDRACFEHRFRLHACKRPPPRPTEVGSRSAASGQASVNGVRDGAWFGDDVEVPAWHVDDRPARLLASAASSTYASLNSTYPFLAAGHGRTGGTGSAKYRNGSLGSSDVTSLRFDSSGISARITSWPNHSDQGEARRLALRRPAREHLGRHQGRVTCDGRDPRIYEDEHWIDRICLRDNVREQRTRSTVCDEHRPRLTGQLVCGFGDDRAPTAEERSLRNGRDDHIVSVVWYDSSATHLHVVGPTRGLWTRTTWLTTGA